MSTIFVNLRKNTSGVTAVEYGLIAALIAIAAIAAMNTVGTSLSGVFTTLSNSL